MEEQNVAQQQRSVALIEADIEENCMEHGIRGILKHQDIVNMLSNYDDEDMQARAWGKFQHLTGLIFKKFSRLVHVIEPFELKYEDWCVTEAFDCHPRTPDALMWVAVDRQGRKIICDEMWKSYDGTDTLAAKIKEKADGKRIVKRLLDPSAWNTDKHTESNFFSELYKNGLLYEKGSKERTLAVIRTKQALDYKYQNGQYLKVPELYIFNTCVRTIWEFEHWQWGEWTGKTAEKKSPMEKPEDKNDHMMENIGRVLLANTTFSEYQRPALQQQIERVRQQQSMVDDPYASQQQLANYGNPIGGSGIQSSLDDPY